MVKDKLDEFVHNYDVDYSDNTVSEKELDEICKRFDLHIGSELREYLLKYGYLGYKQVEMFGINRRQGNASDMIKRTLSFRKKFPDNKNLIALIGSGDDAQYFVNEKDEVVCYLPWVNRFIWIHNSLLEYILDTFKKL